MAASTIKSYPEKMLSLSIFSLLHVSIFFPKFNGRGFGKQGSDDKP